MATASGASFATASTDTNGRFRIDYTSADFRKTPFSPLIDIELMRSWEITLNTAASVSIPSLPSGADTRPGGVSGNEYIDISGWPSCSYQVRLHTRRALTDGEDDDPGNSILRTFCK